MSKVVALEWAPFLREQRSVPKFEKLSAGVPAFLSMGAVKALAMAGGTATSSATWGKIFATAMSIADVTCIGVIIFAGSTWMFGNRTKAIETLFGGGVGYIIIRHAQDIQHWLAGL